ncbi:MAG: AraC family transcriptional regulator [Thalassospira sp. Nap_22]|nr:MAG: AraC family transcriptional regulator [Thalassospira sp. Nap_22]
MLVLPVPMIVALVLGFLFVRALVGQKTPKMLMALLLAAAAQSFLVGLVQYYGIDGLRWLQPITASAIPVMAWMAFVEASLRARLQRGDLLHFSMPALVALCVFFLPVGIDAVLCSLFVGYGSAILVMLRRQRGDFAHMRLTSGQIPALIWRFIAIALIISAISDLLILLAKIGGNDEIAGVVLSVTSSIALLTIGFLSLSPDIAIDVALKDPVDDSQAALSSEQCQAIMNELNALQTQERLYLDPDLTLARISRRMGRPLKQISMAINTTTGENVSRYINKYRIDHACRMLDAGENVTNTMLESGFNTKSNFNREFLRITGKTPSQWQQKTIISREI